MGVCQWETHEGLVVTQEFKRWFLTVATSPETIRRDRQCLQNKDKSLRGPNWGKKQQRGEAVREHFSTGGKGIDFLEL